MDSWNLVFKGGNVLHTIIFLLFISTPLHHIFTDDIKI